MLVSICIPAYEYPHLLQKCLNSIVTQTYKNFEVIITDDSKHDKLREIADSFGDNRIKYFKNNIPLGSPKNWNKCIELASGDLIKILHHDDWFAHDTSLEKFVNKLTSTNSDFVFSSCINHFSKNNKYHSITKHQFSNINKQPFSLLFVNGIGAPSTVMFKKNVANTIKFDNNSKWYVDVIFYTEVLLKNFSIGFINEPLISINADSPTQVTNTTSGLHKVKEMIYTMQKFKLLHKSTFIVNLYIIEIFKRYNQKTIKELNVFSKKLELLLLISKLPIHYKIYALIRRLYFTRNINF
jgi:glycosyltransferase involved in cell wall biosynthesis